MRLHFISNSIFINSGFGKVTRYLALGLKNLGYDVSVTGLQTVQSPQFYYGLECLPIDTGGYVDESTQLFLNLQNIKPDIVIYIGQMDSDLNHLTKLFSKTISYTPVEGSNIPDGMANDLKYIIKNGGCVISQCKYGQQEMKKVGIESIYIYHGYDPEIFYPIKDFKDFKSYCHYRTGVGKINTDPELLHKMGCYDCDNINGKKDCKYFKEELVSILRFVGEKWIQKDIGITKLKDEFKGKFLYLGVMQNFGIRKQIPRLLEAYSILIKDRKFKDRTHLHLHSLPISIKGLNIIKTIQELRINDNVTFSYGTFGTIGWSEQAMNILYNLADANLSASSSEGFGLPTIESMACGKSQVAPNCSSFIELINNGKPRGLLANIATYHHIQDQSIRALVDTKDLASKIKQIYVQEDFRKECEKNCLEFTKDYTWDLIVKQWDKLLKTIP